MEQSLLRAALPTGRAEKYLILADAIGTLVAQGRAERTIRKWLEPPIKHVDDKCTVCRRVWRPAEHNVCPGDLLTKRSCGSELRAVKRGNPERVVESYCVVATHQVMGVVARPVATPSNGLGASWSQRLASPKEAITNVPRGRDSAYSHILACADPDGDANQRGLRVSKTRLSKSGLAFTAGLSVAFLGATFVGVSGSAAVTPSVVSSEACPQNDGTLTVSEADGSSATACSLVGDKVAGELGILSVPDPGYIAEVEDMRVDGGSTSMSVETTLEGNIEVIEGGADSQEAPPSVIPDPTEDPCDSQQYALLARKWYLATVPWYINASTIRTDDLVVSSAITSIRSAMENITQQNNQCGMPDQVDIGQVYKGDTTATAAIGFDAYGTSTCAAASSPSHNGIHTVYFDNRQPGVLGTTCTIAVTHAGANEIVEADIELDRDPNRWTTNGAASGCTNEWDLENLTTHEFGHWFGLDHVGNSHQTMFSWTPACWTGWRTLGKGDVLGLRARY